MNKSSETEEGDVEWSFTPNPAKGEWGTIHARYTLVKLLLRYGI